ncbi:MAG TPA: glycosyltransferase [Candidatus Paceibacterota bacterium]|nr:glycosyltransferase [Candidatus Paceibacterota bacterium]
MRIAILHDYLNQFGGAERVLMALIEMFPHADLYTLLYDDEKTFGFFRQNLKNTSFLDLPVIRRRHRAFIPLMPFAARTLRLKDKYDLVISSTAGYAKGIPTHGAYHISYCHSPLRYAWEIDYLKHLRFSPWPLHRDVLHPIAKWLRNWDKRASEKVNLFVANSKFIANKIRSYYGRDSEIVYPPVDTDVFHPAKISGKRDYYLMAGRLLYYKGFDLGIKAFNFLKKPLKVVGLGPEAAKLKSIADPRYIEFVPFLSDEELRDIYSGARALVFPQIEDFGLVAAEAQACGCPVIAYNQGGGREIVEHKITGVLFNEHQSVPAIVAAVREFETIEFDRKFIATRARRFSKEFFKENMARIVENAGFEV